MPVRILQLTDLHLFADPAERLKGVPTRDSFFDVWDSLKSRVDEFDWIVITGDLAHDEQRGTYEALRDLLGDRVRRCRLVPGNHDDRQHLHNVFSETMPAPSGFVTFSEPAGHWRLIGLDTHVSGEVSGGIDAEQLKWLRGELSRCSAEPTLIFMHHPPVPVGCPWLDRIGLEERGPFCRLTRSSPQVRLISAGHVHHVFEGWLGPAFVVTTPSTCVQFLPYGEKPGYEASPPGFRVFELSDEEYRTEVIRLPEVNYPPES